MALTQEALRKKYAVFYSQFHEMHEELVSDGRGHAGHGPDHDMLVAGYTLLIAGDDHRLAEMAWVASHLHSIDRFFGDDHELITTSMLLLVENTDENLGFNPEDIDEIKLAVLRHARPNAEDDSMVQIVLRDADRLANVMPYVIARAGQFRWKLPVVELGHTGLDMHPESSHQKPRSIHDALIACLEWHPDSGTKFAIRTPKAREIGEELFVYLREWFALSDRHMKMAGL